MKTKILFILLAGCSLALAAWLVRVPNPAQADKVPEKYGDTVREGLEYLVNNQFSDGHWEGEGEDGQHPVAMTGLAGLALLIEGVTCQADGRWPMVREGKSPANIRKAVDWLMDNSQPGRDGLIFSGHASETACYMQGHGLATLFLAGAYTDEIEGTRRKKLHDVLTRAVKYILKAQSTQGGWYYTSRMEGHDFDTISATVVQIQALQAAENAGIPVAGAARNDAQEYLKMALGQGGRPADIAAALACRCNLNYPFPSHRSSFYGGPAKDELCEKWLKYCQTEIPMGRKIQFGRDELTHYYYAQAAFKFGGDTWKDYRKALFDHLQSSQNKDGSWPAGDRMGEGRVFSTAVWCTILQLDKGSHPSMRQWFFDASG